jgi:ribosomal protein S20
MKAKNLVATLAVAGVITAGTAGAAFAADGSTPGNGQAPSGQSANDRTGQGHPLMRRHIVKQAMKVVADTLGVSTDELRAALKSGQSVSEYATSLGKNPQDVVTALVNAANAHIDQAVADGKIPPDKGAAIKARVPERVQKLVDHKFGQHAAPAQQPAV